MLSSTTWNAGLPSGVPIIPCCSSAARNDSIVDFASRRVLTLCSWPTYRPMPATIVVAR